MVGWLVARLAGFDLIALWVGSGEYIGWMGGMACMGEQRVALNRVEIRSE